MTTEKYIHIPEVSDQDPDPAGDGFPDGFDLDLPDIDSKKHDGPVEDFVEWVTCEAGLFEAKLAVDNRDVSLPENVTSIGRIAVRIAGVLSKMVTQRILGS